MMSASPEPESRKGFRSKFLGYTMNDKADDKQEKGEKVDLLRKAMSPIASAAVSEKTAMTLDSPFDALEPLTFEEAEIDSPRLRGKMGTYETQRANSEYRANELRRAMLAYRDRVKGAMEAQRNCVNIIRAVWGGPTKQDDKAKDMVLKLVNVMEDIETTRTAQLVDTLDILDTQMAAYLSDVIMPLQKQSVDFSIVSGGYYTNIQTQLTKKKMDEKLERNLERDREEFFRHQTEYMQSLVQGTGEIRMGLMKNISTFAMGHLDAYRTVPLKLGGVAETERAVTAQLAQERADLQQQKERLKKERQMAREGFSRRYQRRQREGLKEKEGLLVYCMERTLTTLWAPFYAVYHPRTNTLEAQPLADAMDALKSKFYLSLRSTKSGEFSVSVKSVEELSDWSSRPFCFQVSDGENKHVFHALSRNEMEEWLMVLKRGSSPESRNSSAGGVANYGVTDLSHNSSIVTDIIQILESGGMLETEGIYRTGGSIKRIQEVLVTYMGDATAGRRVLLECQSEELTSILKLYLRQVKDPLVPFALYQPTVLTAQLPTLEQQVTALREVLRQLPNHNRTLLLALCNHLARVAACSSSNLMDALNLGKCVGPSVIRSEEGIEMSHMALVGTAMAQLIAHGNTILAVTATEPTNQIDASAGPPELTNQGRGMAPTVAPYVPKQASAQPAIDPTATKEMPSSNPFVDTNPEAQAPLSPELPINLTLETQEQLLRLSAMYPSQVYTSAESAMNTGGDVTPPDSYATPVGSPRLGAAERVASDASMGDSPVFGWAPRPGELGRRISSDEIPPPIPPRTYSISPGPTLPDIQQPGSEQ
eukprot:comp19836_c0_seq1/m.23888 comp19836_c0_seq1/g.23888  ORF comp19836_c0_seq1/g.23888 comp19836_c0_seq1/m.23888 type:complete len:822 (-) comp19836_c0_seq1:43-2508(-)